MRRRMPPGIVRADDTLSDALKSRAESRVERLKKRIRRARAGEAEGVHESRTELRRLRAELEVMSRTGFDPVRTEHLSQRLRRAEKALSRTRDLDVILASLDRYVETHPDVDTSDAGIGSLRKLVMQRREREMERLDERLERGLGRELRAFLEEAAPAGDDATAPQRLVRDVTRGEVWHRYGTLGAYARRLPGDPEALHRFRAECRKLRFVIELFGEALPRGESLAEELRAAQDELGEMHDRYVAAQLILRYREKKRIEPTPAIAAFEAWNLSECERLQESCRVRWLSLLTSRFRSRLADALEDDLETAERQGRPARRGKTSVKRATKTK
jgi:CHAD domain-containing protein